MTVIDLSTLKPPAIAPWRTSASDEIDPRVDLLPELLDALAALAAADDGTDYVVYPTAAVETVLRLVPLLIEDHDLGWQLFSELRDMVLGGAQLADGSDG